MSLKVGSLRLCLGGWFLWPQLGLHTCFGSSGWSWLGWPGWLHFVLHSSSSYGGTFSWPWPRCESKTKPSTQSLSSFCLHHVGQNSTAQSTWHLLLTPRAAQHSDSNHSTLSVLTPKWGFCTLSTCLKHSSLLVSLCSLPLMLQISGHVSFAHGSWKRTDLPPIDSCGTIYSPSTFL